MLKEEIRRNIAHSVNRFMGDHIRKACSEGMTPPDGTGYITDVLNLILSNLPDMSEEELMGAGYPEMDKEKRKEKLGLWTLGILERVYKAYKSKLIKELGE